MTLYVITCIDKPGMMELRVATRPEHLAYIAATKTVRCRVGGPFLDDEGKMTGSLLVVEADDPADVVKFIENDPYRKAGLFERSEFRPWKVTIGTLA